MQLRVRARRDEGRGARVLGGIEASLGDSRRLLREYRGKAAARPRTQSVLVVREDLQDLQILDELERLPRCFVDLRDAGHVAGVVERDLLRERLREGNPFFADQFLDVVGDVEDAEGRVPAPLLVVPGEGPVALRARR